MFGTISDISLGPGISADLTESAGPHQCDHGASQLYHCAADSDEEKTIN